MHIFVYFFPFRDPKQCPECSYCGTSLPRHLQTVHKWAKNRASAAISFLGLRKTYERDLHYSPKKVTPKKGTKDQTRTRKWQNYHHSKVCPFPSCNRVTSNMSQHLNRFHKIETNDQRFYLLLKSAKRVPETFVPHEQQVQYAVHSSQVIPTSNAVTILQSTEVSGSSGSELSSDEECLPKPTEHISTKSHKCSDYIENMFERFYNFMTGPDRGRNLESIETVVNDVRRIVIAVGAKDDLALVFDENCSNLRNNYLMKYCIDRKTKPSSVRKYLYSFIDFCSFLITNKVSITNVTYENIFSTLLTVQGWRKTYSAKDKSLKHIRNAEDYEMIVTPEQVQSYEKSDHAIQAKELFTVVKITGRRLTQQEYCCMRDHLFTVIHFGNGHRSGVSVNLTMTELSKARIINNSMVEIKVWKHKTLDTYGPAQIMLTPQEFKWLEVFAKYARAQVPVGCNNVFVSWNGGAMKSGDVSKRLHKLWLNAGNFENRILPKNLSCTIVRKSTSTGIRTSNTGKYQEAADLMAHSLPTAESHYVLRKRETSAASASEVIRQHYYETSTITSPKKKMWNEEEVTELRSVFYEQSPDHIEQSPDRITKEFVNDKVGGLKAVSASPQQVYDKLKSMERYKIVNITQNEQLVSAYFFYFFYFRPHLIINLIY